MGQGVQAADTDPGFLAGSKRQALALFRGAAGFDQDVVVAEGHRGSNGAHAGDGGQLQAQALGGAAEAGLDHLAFCQGNPLQLRGFGRQRNILGPKQDLHAVV